MIADGLNKGVIDRRVLQKAITDAEWTIEHQPMIHAMSKTNLATTTATDEVDETQMPDRISKTRAT